MFLKNVFDFAASLVGLLILFPFLLLVALIIKIRMPEGPVLFTQERVGKGGRFFTMYKFRSMTVSHSGSSVSVKGESRITSFGALLRAYKIDELPELWNVLTGDMSLVGPRPDVPGYADRLQGEEREILKLKPGITGPASLKYRREEELLAQQADPQRYNDEIIFPDKVRINLNYLKHQSFGLDLKIIIYTLLRKDLEEEYLK